MKKLNGFTLVELLAVIVILAIILAISIPSISGVITSSKKGSFESDAKMVLKAIDYKKIENNDFDPSTLTKDNITTLLGLSSQNYNSLSLTIEEGIPIITIVGTGKWDNLVACGTFQNMRVVTSTGECSTDLVAPVITLNGENPVNIYVGETYSDAGATATDDKDGDITSRIITTGIVNINLSGTYTITYSVKDNGNNTTNTTRTINVIDNVEPVISFDQNGNSSPSNTALTTVTVTDIHSGIDASSLKYLWSSESSNVLEGDITNSFNIGEALSTSPSDYVGPLYLWVIAKDNSGNTKILSSNAFNIDSVIPVITVDPVTVSTPRGSAYTDIGVTASDNSGDLTSSIIRTGTVNINIIGSYIITYDVTDTAGNSAQSKTRTVNVIDVDAPVITVLGSNPINVNVGSSYTDAGATAIDDVDGEITVSTTSNVNTNAIGSYTVTYTATDTASNTATATRIVNVIDTVLPTVSFGTNGNSTYAKTRSTTVNASDNVAINASSLKYLWNTSSTAPSEASFSSTFSNGGTISTPAGVTGDYYLWILAKDSSGNTRIQGSNVFKLDNSVPTYSSYEIKNITSSGYDVYLYGVNDSQSGINRIQFPTWTSLNGQDDIQTNWETNAIASGTNQGSGTWYYRVNVSAHNNESGTYTTHIYLYDNAGNSVGLTPSAVTVPPSVYYLADVVNVGDFVSYTGNNGCTNCSGESVTCYQTYANTYSGWRVLSKSGSGASGVVNIVSAGTTRCIGSGTAATINGYTTAYMNTTYATSARSINCNDALPYTSAACTNYTTYVSDAMIQPGGFYYFATATSEGGSVLWAIVESGRFNTNAGYTFGLRPVITLKSGIIKTGGSGTNGSPYTIGIQ